MSTNFNLTTASPAVNVIQSINYLLATQGASTSANANVIIGNNVVQANTITGQVYTNGLGTISYIYGYVDVKYANSATGSSGFTSNSTLANYYGIYNNSTGIESVNPVDYQWTQVVGGFGTTKGLYYTTGGGRTISFYVGSSAPTVNYTAVPDNTPILLATLANSIVVGNSISPAAVTNVAIASNTIQGRNIQIATITGNLVAANTITGNTIQAGTITGNNIAAGTITANLLAANIIFVNQSIQSTNAIFGNTSSPGFWLDASSGNVRFGGNTSIGNNLTIGANATVGGNLFVGANATIQGIITTGTINANTVNTNQLVVSAATQVVSGFNNTGSQLINWVNGNATINGAGYLWPLYTRGFALGGGTTITTTTNGAVGGSSLQINYNAYISAPNNSQYNCVELWRTGSSAYYKSTFNIVRSSYAYPAGSAAIVNGGDIFSIPGNAGSYYQGNIGNIKSITTGITSNLYDVFYSPAGSPILNLYGQTGTLLVGTISSSNSALTTYFNGNVAGVYGNVSYPLFNILGVVQFSDYPHSPNLYDPAFLVGSSGYIAYTNTQEYTTPQVWQFQQSNTLADLNDIESDVFPNLYTYSGQTINFVAVGTSGTIVYNNYVLNSVGNITSSGTWTQASSGTINNLKAVQSNYTLTTRANTWVTVGQAGTILYSTNPSGPWLKANSVPTTNNLNAVGYTNGYWVAVGDAGTIITSTDATNWSGPIANPADGVTVPANGARNLYGVAGGLNYGSFVAAGEEIILTSNTANPNGGWNSNAYLGGSSLTSSLTRLQYQGSWANVANQTQPPTQQQIANGQVVSGFYNDINYTSGQNITYYLVVGNMLGNNSVYTNGPNLTITEIKR